MDKDRLFKGKFVIAGTYSKSPPKLLLRGGREFWFVVTFWHFSSSFSFLQTVLFKWATLVWFQQQLFHLSFGQRFHFQSDTLDFCQWVCLKSCAFPTKNLWYKEPTWLYFTIFLFLSCFFFFYFTITTSFPHIRLWTTKQRRWRIFGIPHQREGWLKPRLWRTGSRVSSLWQEANLGRVMEMKVATPRGSPQQLASNGRNHFWTQIAMECVRERNLFLCCYSSSCSLKVYYIILMYAYSMRIYNIYLSSATF